jgi:hypothetical protein
MISRDIPEDFPRGPGAGAVPGSHPKLLLRQVGGAFVSGWTDEERALRYEICADMVSQLTPYIRRKGEQNPDWGREVLERRLAAGIRAKWNFTDIEIAWMSRRACEGL